MRFLRTSEVAKAVGIHPNTVRLYEQWGYLPAPARNQSGYRKFTEAHIDQLRLIRTGQHLTWLGGGIRRAAILTIELSAAGKLSEALEQAVCSLKYVQTEKVRAEEAVELLECWAKGQDTEDPGKTLQTREVVKLLDITFDTLRNWERNGLLNIPRDAKNGYRIYRKAELDRLKVIRALRQARYSNMAILRMFQSFDKGNRRDLRRTLDTIGHHEKAMLQEEDTLYYNTDRWLSTLAESEKYAEEMISFLKSMLDKYGNTMK